MTNPEPASATADESTVPTKRPNKKLRKAMMLVRRIHLYVGLFLLPWVFLYGVTGAMYNHSGLFPEIDRYSVDPSLLEQSTLSSLPTAKQLAMQVVAELKNFAPDSTISLVGDHSAQFSNDIILEVLDGDTKRSVQIDPVAHSATVVVQPKNEESFDVLFKDVRSLKLANDPYSLAKQAVPDILTAAGFESTDSVRPMGWCKLNFIAKIDGELARVTYVLRDGHLDITRYEGQDGMSLRQFSLRLHTTHGQPPHWNGRMYWSLILDTMAIAMVTWGLSGLIMWWQIKRTRLIGSLVIVASLITATGLYISMLDFYATTKL